MTQKYDFYSLAVMAAVISFLGFVTENIWLSVRKGYIDNRNMTFPFLMGYGIMVDGIYLIIGTPETLYASGIRDLSLEECRAVYLLAAAVAVSIGEIILGKAVEKIFGFEYWNYEKLPMHITKYTSVPTSLGFALIITFFTDNCFCPIMEVITGMEGKTLKVTAVVLLFIMSADFVISFGRMYSTGKLNERWRIELPAFRKDCRKTKRI